MDAVIQAELQRCCLTEADELHDLRRVDAAHLSWAEMVTDTIRSESSGRVMLGLEPDHPIFLFLAPIPED